MSRHLLFLVHGMGVHPADLWADAIINKLKTLSRKYPFFQRYPLDDFVTFIPVNYDDILDKILQTWADDSSKITGFAHSFNLPDADSIAWLSTAGDTEKNFFWTHCADVVLYRFYSIVRDDIRIRIVKQMIETINAEIDRNDDTTPLCSVMAHSFGTAVAHDCVHSLGLGKPGMPNPYSPDHFRFQNIFMLANTSNLLHNDIEPYAGSIVRPGGQTDAHAYCYQYFNFRNELDPVACTARFAPGPGWGKGFFDISINHIHQINVHDWLTYLDNPRVHIPILVSLSVGSAIKETEKNAAIAAFPSFVPSGVLTDIGAAAAELDKVQNALGHGTTMGSIVNGLIHYASILGIDKISSEIGGAA
jgi:hypothetical protein